MNSKTHCPHPIVQEWIEWEVKLHNLDLYFSAARDRISPKNLDARYIQFFDDSWKLPYALVPRSKYSDFLHDTGALSDHARALLFDDTAAPSYRFFIHPDQSDLVSSRLPGDIRFVSAEESNFFALPTSSCRTLAIWNQELSSSPIMVKVSVFRKVGSRIRYVDWGECCYHIRSRSVLQSLQKGDFIAESMRLLDEVAFLGIPLSRSIPVVNPLKPEESNELFDLGNIVRDFPSDLLSGETKMLCSTSYMSPLRDPETFIESIAKSTNRSALLSLQETLIDPGFQAIESLAMNHGVSIEPHAQNILINLDRKFIPHGNLTLRDFGMICVDPLRAFLLSPQTLYTLIGHHLDPTLIEKETETGRSNVLMSMGHHFIYMNVQRALLSLFSRNMISESQAENAIHSLCTRAMEFLERYYRRSFECDLLDPISAWVDGLSVELRPRIADYEQEFVFSSRNLQQCEDTLRGTGNSESLKLAALYEPIPPNPLDWFKHPSGYAGIKDDRIVCLVMHSRPA